MKNTLALTILGLALCLTQAASALALGDWFIDPNIAVGFNSEQGTVVRLGVDAGLHLDANLYTGVGASIATGKNGEHDREVGAGPFVGYVYPVAHFFSLHVREDVDYVDVRVPIESGNPPVVQSHTTIYGVESATSVGASVNFNGNFGISGGYRMVVGLSGNDIAKGRSGTYLGLSIGF